MSEQRKYPLDYSTHPDFWKYDDPGPIMRAPRNTLVLPEAPKNQPDHPYPTVVVPYAPTNTTAVSLVTTYDDRAQGFVRKVTVVAAVTGVLSVVVAIIGFSVPFLSLPILAWFLTAFCLTFISAYIWDTLASPDGVALLHTVFGWIFLFREQNRRHREHNR